MIKRIAAFGDSFIAGIELPFDDPDLKPLSDQAFKDVRSLDHTGSIPYADLSMKHHQARMDLEQSIPDYFQRCFDYSLSGYLASKLSVPHSNYGFMGYSNDAIMADLIKQRHALDAQTLVIVGVTFPARETQLAVPTDHGRVKCFTNHNQFALNSRHAAYLDAYLEFSNDMLVKFLQAKNHLSSVRELLQGIPHVIIDPQNIYRESPDITEPLFGWDYNNVVRSTIEHTGELIIHPEIVDAVQQYFNANLFAYTLNHAMIEVHRTGARSRCMLGHPNRASHELFVDQYLWPYLVQQGMI